jgi:hypothetical protein
MHRPLRRRSEPLRLPIVDVDFMVRVFRDPKTTRSLVGVRRQVVEKATQVLEKAKRNQIDGQVELDVSNLGLVLQAAALTIEWQGDLLFFRFDDEEQA